MQGAPEVRIREVDAKSITRVRAITDPWFVGRYGMNLYRGCEHGCAYCDGRAERYRVEGCFDREIVVKRNAATVLARELARIREPGFVFLGGGVSDAYQPVERRYALARAVLEVVERASLPVHVLTKSTLVERDLDLLGRIHERAGVIVSCSIATCDEAVRERFEPRAAGIEARWALLAKAREAGFGTGVMAMPVLPGISDQAEHVERLFARAAEERVDFVLAGGLTLRPGVQMELYLDAVRRLDPGLLEGYGRLYRDRRPSGMGDPRYYARLEGRFSEARARHGIPGRIPRRLFHGRIPAYVELAVLLEHRGFARREQGRPGRTLEAAGLALQRWARGRLAGDHRRILSAEALEREFDSMVNDQSILKLEGFPAHATPAVRALWDEIQQPPRGGTAPD